MGAEAGVMWLQAKEHLWPAEAGGGSGLSPKGVPRGSTALLSPGFSSATLILHSDP